MQARKLDLTTLCGGALPELFERELRDVMANIADPNTDTKKPRQIRITIDVHPRNDRQNCDVELGVTSKVLPVVKVAGSLFIAQNAGRLEGFTTDVRQQDIFPEEEHAKRPYVLKKGESNA